MEHLSRESSPKKHNQAVNIPEMKQNIHDTGLSLSKSLKMLCKEPTCVSREHHVIRLPSDPLPLGNEKLLHWAICNIHFDHHRHPRCRISRRLRSVCIIVSCGRPFHFYNIRGPHRFPSVLRKACPLYIDNFIDIIIGTVLVRLSR